MLVISIITETKLENIFPVSQFHIDGYSKRYKLDRNRNGDGIIIYFREDIPSRMLAKGNLQIISKAYCRTSLQKKSNRLVGGIYHQPSQPDEYIFNTLVKALDVYSFYEGVLLVGDFNVQIGETNLNTFLHQHEPANINKLPTCHKSSESSNCIDFILSNSFRPKSFFKTNTVFRELSDFHKLVLSVFKTTFPKS